MKKALLITFVLFFATAVAGLQVSIDQVEDTATVDEPGQVNISVLNNHSSQQEIELALRDYYRSQWYSYPESIQTNPGETAEFPVKINPDSSAVQGIYRADFTVRSSQAEVRDSFSYRVTRDTGLNLIDIQQNQSYRPGEEFDVGLTFRNVDSSTSEYRDVQLSVFNQSKTEELGPIVPGGERRINSNFEIPKYESPGKKQLIISLNGRNYTETVTVEEVEDINETSETENRLLVVNERVEVKNTGNVDYNYTHVIEKPSYISPVVEAAGAKTVDTDSGTAYRWEINLSPGETATLEARTDYWIPLTGLILLLGGFVTLKKITSSVNATKKVTKTEEGLDVTIEVENSSSQSFEDVLLEDFIPNIAGLHNKFDMADPEVKQTDEGAELRWWINDLEPGDQRIFKYSIKPKVEVEEGVELEPAVLKNGEKVLDKTKEISAEFKPE